MADPVFVDGSTPLNAANMNKLQTRDEKAQANGYPSLDGTGKVPLAQLPPLGSTDNLHYLGDYVAGSNVEGDIVVYQGVAYLAVRPTSAAPTPWSLAPQAVAYGTTLPASPTDGQEAILVDNPANPSYQWRFRYNASSTSAYKWEFVGGTQLTARVDTRESKVEQLPFGDLATLGPSVTLPRAGQYTLEIGCSMDYVNVITTSYMGVQIGATAPSFGYAAVGSAPVGQYAAATIGPTVVTANASDVVIAKYSTGNQGGGGYVTYFHRRWLRVTPMRVS